jgi:hypothetical protein
MMYTESDSKFGFWPDVKASGLGDSKRVHIKLDYVPFAIS